MQVARGDAAAFRLIFNNYWDQVYSTACMFTKSPEMAEDITQDVFAQIWVKRETLDEINRFEAFLYTTTRNMIVDRQRKAAHAAAYCDYLQAYFDEHGENPAQQVEIKQFEQSIHKAISKLPAQQQQAFRLSRFNDMSHGEIAAVMGISRQSVKSYIVRAMATLRKNLREEQAGLLLVIVLLLLNG